QPIEFHARTAPPDQRKEEIETGCEIEKEEREEQLPHRLAGAHETESLAPQARRGFAQHFDSGRIHVTDADRGPVLFSGAHERTKLIADGLATLDVIEKDVARRSSHVHLARDGGSDRGT